MHLPKNIFQILKILRFLVDKWGTSVGFIGRGLFFPSPFAIPLLPLCSPWRCDLTLKSRLNPVKTNIEWTLPSEQVEAIIAAAITLIGVHEVGFSNRGPVVDKIADAGSAGKGVPWCMNAVEYIHNLAKCPLPIKTSSVWAFLNWAKTEGKIVQRPRRGDSVCFAFHSVSPVDHVGIVEKVLGLGPILTLRTLEGNTTPDGQVGSQENGGAFARKRRVVKRSSVAFIRV